jgi:hypothetical protein
LARLESKYTTNRFLLSLSENQGETAARDKSNAYRRRQFIASLGLDANFGIADLQAVIFTERSWYDDKSSPRTGSKAPAKARFLITGLVSGDRVASLNHTNQHDRDCHYQKNVNVTAQRV